MGLGKIVSYSKSIRNSGTTNRLSNENQLACLEVHSQFEILGVEAVDGAFKTPEVAAIDTAVGLFMLLLLFSILFYFHNRLGK